MGSKGGLEVRKRAGGAGREGISQKGMREGQSSEKHKLEEKKKEILQQKVFLLSGQPKGIKN